MDMLKKTLTTDPGERTVRLCAVQGCCPELSITAMGVTITDDDGNTIKMSLEHFTDLKNKVRNGELD